MNHKLHEAMNEISDKHLLEAESYQKRTFPYWIAATAALLALVITLAAAFGNHSTDPLLNHIWPTTVFQPDHTRPTGSLPPNTAPTLPKPSGITSPESWQLTNLVAAPAYPKMVQVPNRTDSKLQEYMVALDAYLAAQKAQYDQPEGYADSLTNFFHVSIAHFLQSDGNAAYSPLNVYMAMAILAETTGGNSRQQILDLFGVNSIEELRTQASHVWNAQYSDDGASTLLMANSLWLRSAFPYHQDTADRLAQFYYSSVFHGDLGTDSLNKQLQEWLNANTGGLLKEQANNVELSQDTVFALASTIYFSAGWNNEFYKENTWDETFHSPAGDITASFMHKSNMDTYYRGTHFGAIQLQLSGSNRMWLILPDEGYTTEDILKSDEYLRLTLDPKNWPDQKYCEIHLSLPKFDVVQQQDLISGMKKLGITDVFDSEISDFSPISDMRNLYINQINHAARVAIDEEGCISVAFTVMDVYGEGFPSEITNINFTLDRPFLFIVSSRDNLPLFAGIIKEP